jgi:hypothetical protein
LGQEPEEFVEIEPSFPNRQMVIPFTMVVMQVDFTEIVTQDLDPNTKRHVAEHMVVTRIETESEMG